ncbi:MAG: hypothetical protein ACI9QL_005199 [Candidatus Omnitrophota bacterium]|jgi:hypothetical protein
MVTDGFDSFDFWYAVNNTEVLRTPSRQLETFGTTMVNYFLISELMDTVDKVRVREGRIEAARPQILTPGDLGNAALEGFSDEEASRYVEWLSNNAQHLRILHYGFAISKENVNDHVVSDTVGQVVDNVMQDVARRDDPLSAILVGVDKPWEVCLLKLMVDLVENSASGNIQDLEQHGFPGSPQERRREIDQAFLAASRDASQISSLHRHLMQLGVFEEYEDRFFALVRASESS